MGNSLSLELIFFYRLALFLSDCFQGFFSCQNFIPCVPPVDVSGFVTFGVLPASWFFRFTLLTKLKSFLWKLLFLWIFFHSYHSFFSAHRKLMICMLTTLCFCPTCSWESDYFFSSLFSLCCSDCWPVLKYSNPIFPHLYCWVCPMSSKNLLLYFSVVQFTFFFNIAGASSKESACNAGDRRSIPGLGRSPGEGNGNPPQYSCLENFMDRAAWWESQSVRHDWVTNTFTFHLLFLHWDFFSLFLFFLICFKRICSCCGSIFLIAALKSLLNSPNIRFTLVLVSADWLFSIKLWFPGFYYDGWFFIVSLSFGLLR